MSTCFFIGHRDAPGFLQEKLNKTVQYLWRRCGVTEFIVGHHGSFDHMAVYAVEKAKADNPDLYAYLLLETYRARQTVSLPERFDSLYTPPELILGHPRYAIEKANRMMLRECDYLVSYVTHDGGNAAKILRAAKRLEKEGLIIINLAQEQEFL